MVFDAKHKGSASKVAAGIINPITGHRWNLTENFHDYLTAAKALYATIEATLECELLRPVKQTRLIKNKGQSEYFEKRLKQANYQSLLQTVDQAPLKNTGYGFAEVAQSYHFNSQNLLDYMSKWLRLQDSIKCEPFDYGALKINAKEIQYRCRNNELISAKKVVFCEGYQAINNPWLKDLPFKLAKGSVLEICAEQIKAIDNETMSLLNWGHWLLVDVHNHARLGSTYDWNDTSIDASNDNQQKLLNSLYKYSGLRAQVITHKTGVRPTTKQRQPFVGALSNLQHAYCLNGLGSKGCLIAPYYVDLLVQHMHNNSPLPACLLYTSPSPRD